MKNRFFTNWLAPCIVALAMAATVSAETVDRNAKVVRIQGAARYSTGGNIWQPVQVGTVLRSGAIVQTAQNSFVDVVMGGGPQTAKRPATGESMSFNPTPAAPKDIVRIYPDSVLSIDKLTVTDTGADKVTDTQLDLRSGKIVGAVRKVSAASTFEIKIPNGVAGIRGTVFSISALGIIAVTEGSVVVAYNTPSGPKTETISAGYEYDIRTGEIKKTVEPIDLSGRSYDGIPTVYVPQPNNDPSQANPNSAEESSPPPPPPPDKS